jgi:hypothetical protein
MVGVVAEGLGERGADVDGAGAGGQAVVGVPMSHSAYKRFEVSSVFEPLSITTRPWWPFSVSRPNR